MLDSKTIIYILNKYGLTIFGIIVLVIGLIFKTELYVAILQNYGLIGLISFLALVIGLLSLLIILGISTSPSFTIALFKV